MKFRHSAVAGGPLLIAHRGGAGLAPENTLLACQRAAHDWGADLIELDVQATRDGACVLMHDARVDRTTNGGGLVAELTLAELQRLDAGYHFSADGGQSFPYRGIGVRVPTVAEVLAQLPHTRLIAELKTAAAQRPLFEAIAAAGAEQRVLVAGERNAFRTRLDAYSGPKSASLEQLRRFLFLRRLRLARFWAPPVDAVQMPEFWQGRRVLTPGLVADLHAHGLPVHVWTVNVTEDMHRLLDWEVDGIITDRPDLLEQLLHERFGRPQASAGQELE